MKKRNLVKKAVLPALVALVCSVIALTSVSYAWFSLGDTAKVDGMQMQVTTADGLQISSTGNANDFKSTLDLSAKKATNVNPISTDGKYAGSKLNFYTGEIVDGQLGGVKAAAATDYITFDIYVKVSSDTTLRLDANSVVVMPEGSDLQTNLASRVAFINLGNADTPAGAQNLNPAEVSATNVKIWEPNSAERSTAAANAGAVTGKLNYKGIISTAGAESNDYVSTFDVSGNTPAELFALGAGYNKIRVYIWLEGQDVDCVNEVSGGTFNITLNLSKPTKPTKPTSN